MAAGGVGSLEGLIRRVNAVTSALARAGGCLRGDVPP